MRPARLLIATGLAALAASTGHAQDLLTIRGSGAEATGRAAASTSTTASAAAATVQAGSGFDAFDAPTWAVDVDLDLVRSAPRRLVLPAPDGRTLGAELTVFEDRGGGDAMWSGRFPGAEYDSVVLTIEGGRLAGRFDEPAGAQFRIGADAGGGGAMVGQRAPHGDERHYCPVGSPGHESARLVHAAPAAAAAAGPEKVGAAASDGRLDILILYTAEAARIWAPLGGAQASIRNAVDYLNLVLRNGRIDLRARAVHVAQAPDVLDRVGRDGATVFSRNLLARLRANGEVAALRIRHKADAVHLLTGEQRRLLGATGVAGLLMRGDSAASFSPNAHGYTVVDGAEAKTFAHEVGHNLGANHAPDNAGPPGEAVRPYAFGHIYSTMGADHGTAMTYAAQVEPYFSSTRIAPAGYRIGVAGKRDNERALRGTAAIASRFGDSLVTPGTPNAPSDVRAEALNGSTMRVSWRDNSNDEGGFEIRVARFGSAPHHRRRTAANVRSVDLTGLESGVHVVTVYAFNGRGLSPLGGGVDVTLPGWRPEAPTNVRVTAASEAAADVSWSHDDYVFFEIHALRDGDVWRRTYVSPGARSGRVPVEPGARYGFRVYAYTDLGGRSAPSRTVNRNFPAAGAGIAAPTDFRATILDATTVRLDWTDNASNKSGYTTDASRWDWSSTDVLKPNRTSHVYRGLRPGELYKAAVTVYGEDGSRARVETGFVLPAASGGPAAPTNLAYDAAAQRLTWSDNSSDEAGFEVQYRQPPEISRWRRLTMLPADAQSYQYRDRFGWDYRVVAWNAAGVSASDAVRLNPPAEPPPQPPPGPPTTTGFAAAPAGAEAIDLTWTDEWAAPSRGTLAIEARTFRRPAWREVASSPATAGSARVSGLDRDTPYTFRLRSGSEASGNASATTGDPVGDCRSGQRYLCLRQKRFEVRVHWSNPDSAGDNGAGAAVPVAISDESGLFWFFDPDNIELAVKVLDGRGVNGAFWVFFGALTDVEYWLTVEDTEGGGRRTYHNPPKTTCGQSDVAAFAAGASASGAAASRVSGAPASGRATGAPGIDLLRLRATPLDLETVEAAANGGGSCEPGDGRLCLLDGRFAVEVRFVDPNAGPAAARVIPSLTTAKTGFFWFFSPSNIELATKLLDGRPINGRFWFLYGGLSDVEYEIVVTDTATRDVKTYRNEAGSLCGQIDTEAL